MSARVFVGMSGGVDSSLAAALLVEAGLEVTGVYMRNWTDDLPGHECPWAGDLADAEAVAVRLGIDLLVWDFEEAYKREVVDYLVDAYERGLTPNPDVICNERIKFGLFAERALAAGADYVATGHYARAGLSLTSMCQESHPPTSMWQKSRFVHWASEAQSNEQNAISATGWGEPRAEAGAPTARLFRAADEHKDQTYFLWRVDGGVLSRVIFPIGGISSKDEVRRMAAERGLATAEKPDSTGICFVGEVGIRQFLLSRLERRPGPIRDAETGETLGMHEGAFLFTLGQRKGLDLGGGPARFVVGTDPAENIVWVSDDRRHEALRTRSLSLSDCRWVAGGPPADGRYLVRTRHTRELVEASLEVGGADGGEDGGGGARVVFDGEVEAVAPGQSVVVYDGMECLGGGVAVR